MPAKILKPWGEEVTAASDRRIEIQHLDAMALGGRPPGARGGGTLGIVIPPSVILVIYAIRAEQNIEKLFVAALIRGILAAASHMIVISTRVRVSPNAATVCPRVPWA